MRDRLNLSEKKSHDDVKETNKQTKTQKTEAEKKPTLSSAQTPEFRSVY